MTTTPTEDTRTTSFIGAHQWTITKRGGWDAVCVCGDREHIASYDMQFVMECFARHAGRKLQEAAVALILENRPRNRQTMESLKQRAKRLQEAGETDKGNLLMLASSHLYSELEAAQEEQYRSLTWYGWPDDVEGVAPGLAADVDDIWPERFWLEIQPNPYFERRQFKNWRWEAWRITEGGDETRITSGQADTREEAQRASWDALV